MVATPLLNIVIADDHNFFAQSIAEGLAKKRYNIVGIASNGKEVLALIKQYKVDLILMDFEMPIMNGIEATKIITQQQPIIKVIILSMYVKYYYVQEALSAGAKGCISKNSKYDEFETAINEVLKGNIYLSPDVTKIYVQGVNEEKQGRGIQISKLEIEMLPLLNKGLTSKQIAEKLERNYHFINSLRRTMMAKFEVKSVTALLGAARELGFLK